MHMVRNGKYKRSPKKQKQRELHLMSQVKDGPYNSVPDMPRPPSAYRRLKMPSPAEIQEKFGNEIPGE